MLVLSELVRLQVHGSGGLNCGLNVEILEPLRMIGCDDLAAGSNDSIAEDAGVGDGFPGSAERELSQVARRLLAWRWLRCRGPDWAASSADAAASSCRWSITCCPSGGGARRTPGQTSVVSQTCGEIDCSWPSTGLWHAAFGDRDASSVVPKRLP